jgi:hypothetical protein
MWSSAYLASTRPWVQIPVLPKNPSKAKLKFSILFENTKVQIKVCEIIDKYILFII